MSRENDARGSGCSTAVWIVAVLLVLVLVPLTCAVLFTGYTYTRVVPDPGQEHTAPASDPASAESPAPAENR